MSATADLQSACPPWAKMLTPVCSHYTIVDQTNGNQTRASGYTTREIRTLTVRNLSPVSLPVGIEWFGGQINLAPPKH